MKNNKVDAFEHPDDKAVGGQFPYWNPHFHGKGKTKRDGRVGDFLLGTILRVRKLDGNVKYAVDVDIQTEVAGRDVGATLNGKAYEDDTPILSWSLNKTYEDIGQECLKSIGCFLTVRYDGERKVKGRDEAMADWHVRISKNPVVEVDREIA